MDQQKLIEYRANGKLLLSAEYFVLDGALALALPTRLGQTLALRAGDVKTILHWRSHDADGRRWFEGDFDPDDGRYLRGDDPAVGEKLATALNAAFSAGRADRRAEGLVVECRLEFSRRWGLGSSSSLIALLGQWTGADPFALGAATFGGSGYDIACALAAGPILYQRREEKPHYVDIPFSPGFKDQLYFVYLGQKQDTREGIANYRRRAHRRPDMIERASALTYAFLRARDLPEFEDIVEAHEALVASATGLPRAKDTRLAGYWGAVKSLGAWGGDFALLSSDREESHTRDYLAGRGFHICIPYRNLILE
jgi:mevalonate kinase